MHNLDCQALEEEMKGGEIDSSVSVCNNRDLFESGEAASMHCLAHQRCCHCDSACTVRCCFSAIQTTNNTNNTTCS